MTNTESASDSNLLIHGDAFEVLPTLPDNSFDLIFVDPPYNLRLKQRIERPEGTDFDGVDESWDKVGGLYEYEKFTVDYLSQCQRLLKDSGTIWVMGTYHNIFAVGYLMQNLGFWILNDVIWVKANPTPQFRGVRFCNAHEHLIWAKKSEQAKGYTFNYAWLKEQNNGKQMRSDWYIGDEDLIFGKICQGKERIKGEDGKSLHSTQKPEALLERILLATTRPGDLVLDPFAGTGTFLKVAAEAGRRYVGIEQDVRYVQAGRGRLGLDG